MYIYQADIYCDGCGEKLCQELEAPDDLDEYNYDSDDYPKGPYPEEEADYPQHCGACQVFLKNPLTDDGIEYLKETIENNLSSEITELWVEYYSDYLS